MSKETQNAGDAAAKAAAELAAKEAADKAALEQAAAEAAAKAPKKAKARVLSERRYPDGRVVKVMTDDVRTWKEGAE
jgi:hypothetical protein